MPNGFGQALAFIKQCRVLQDGFEAHSGEMFHIRNGIYTHVTGRFLGSAITTNSSFSDFSYLITPTNAFAFGVAFYIDSNNLDLVYIQGTGGMQFQINCESGFIRLRRGTTLIASGSTVIVPSIWYYLEGGAIVANSGGYAEVRINGLPEITFSGDTQQGATTVDQFTFQGANRTWDDLYINNDLRFDGDQVMETIYPTGIGTYAEWQSSSIDPNWMNVDEANQPNGDTDFNQAVTIGLRDLHTMGNITPASARIMAVSTQIYSKKTSAGNIALKPMLKTGGTEIEKSSFSPNASYIYNQQIAEINPVTNAAWITEEVNDIEAGYERVE